MITNPLEKLFVVYREELELYREVLDLVTREQQALSADRPLTEIITSLEKKRDLLRRVSDLERSIATEKDAFRFRRTAFDAAQTRKLGGLINVVKEVIQEILLIEEGNERVIIDGRETTPQNETPQPEGVPCP